MRNSVLGPQTSLLQNFPSAVADPGGGSGGTNPPIRPYACLRLKFLHQQDHHNFISFFNFLIFFMKYTLHFATKLNSRDIQKCNWFWVPSCDMFAYRKAVFPAPMVTGVHRLRNKCLSLLSLLVNNYCNNSADNMQLRLVGGDVVEK